MMEKKTKTIGDVLIEMGKNPAEYLIACEEQRKQQATVRRRRGDMIEDGFGSSCSAWCTKCGEKSMYVCRPGDIRCSNCDR